MADRYDVIVIGLGGMGTASAYHLARRGQRVLGLEQHDLLHELGSSHGLTRIIRLAYHEHPSYVPLLRRSYELWHELASLAGEQLLITTGSIEGGPEDGSTFRGALEAARIHDLPHEVLDVPELRRRFPAYGDLDPTTRVVFQPDGGFLLAERTLLAHVNQAMAHGAELRFHEPVERWEATPGGGVRVSTPRATYQADRLVICAGPWAGRVVPELVPLAVPERQVLAWLQPTRPELFTPDRFPVFLLDVPDGSITGSRCTTCQASSSGAFTTCASRWIPMTPIGPLVRTTRRSCERSPSATSRVALDRPSCSRGASSPTRRMSTSSSIFCPMRRK